MSKTARAPLDYPTTDEIRHACARFGIAPLENPFITPSGERLWEPWKDRGAPRP